VEYYNRHLDRDVVALLDAAAALEVTEFRFFELAFEDWHGRRASQPLIEKHFVAYMFAERVPTWVRQFARKVLKLAASGELDPAQFGIFKRLPSGRMIRLGKVYALIILVLSALILLLTVYAPENLLNAVRGCYFPPCY